MNLNELSETVAIVKAALRIERGGPFGRQFAINYLQGTEYWPKGGKLNRAALLADLAENPRKLRKFTGIGEVAEREIFCHLLATVGEK